ncbi:MAG: SpvB/TcaC N-terminal domain-containing protein [Candidatus Aceula meridiana]|nr:SpvB/TcaC N-terminal domain-containing protein [Candidatus Aceula meridiana]
MRYQKFFIILFVAMFIGLSTVNLSAKGEEKITAASIGEGEHKATPESADLQPQTNQSKDEKPSQGTNSKALFEDKAFESVEKLTVDPASGTAAVSLSIQAPRGRAGIEPAIFLSYNSGLPNGFLGVGWSLSLGKIIRSTKFGIPKYTNEDTFVLAQSGSQQKLVDISGDETEFRPEIEGAFMKIEFINNDHWLVTDRKGIKYYFGQGDDSRVVDPDNTSRVFEWDLDRVEDLHGNYMVITHTKDLNQIYPDKIYYTGNSQTGLEPHARIEFHWDSRLDKIFSYKSHFLIETRRRLFQIRVYTGAYQQYAQYCFTYEKSSETGRSLLSSVERKGFNSSESLPATFFTYNQGEKGFEESSGWTIPAEAKFGEHQAGGRYADLGVRVIDVNGDGRPDFCKYHKYHGGQETRKTFLHDGNQSWVESPVNWKFPDEVIQFLDTAPEIDRGWGVRIADLNADGRPDLVRHYQYHPPAEGGSIVNQAFINNGVDGWDYDEDWLLPEEGNLPIAWEIGQPVYGYTEFTGNLLADVNGDGYADYIKSKEDGWAPWFQPTTHMSFINNLADNSGWHYDETWNTPSEIYTDLAHGAILIDLNGDGLNDIMYSKDNTQKIYINNGSNWVEDPYSSWKDTHGHTDFNNGSTQAADINGDGLADLIVSDDSNQKVLINHGTGWTVDDEWIVPGNLKSYGTRLLDANADGMLDVVKHFNGEAPVVYLNKAGVPDILISMDNGVGGVRSIEYDSACRYSNIFFPFASQVVKAITVSDGQGHSYKTQYFYADGLWDSQERESRGFGYVKVIDPDGNYSETYYHQDDFFKGRIESQRAYDAAGNLYARGENVWDYEEVYPGVNFVFLLQKDNFIYDGDSTGRRTQEKYFYEESPQLGNLTKIIQLGEVDLATGNDISEDGRSTETEYFNNTLGDNWLLGILKKVVVKNNNNETVRKTWIYYDGDENHSSFPTLGLLTKKENWTGDEPGSENIVTRYTYDEYGNLKTTKDSDENQTEITYDPDYFIFPLEIKNVLEHKVTKQYYGVNGVSLFAANGYWSLWGQVKLVQDPNNQEGIKQYDGFGRLRAAISPLDSNSSPTVEYDYQLSSSGVKVFTFKRQRYNTTDTLDFVQFYDGLGRLIQTKTESTTPHIFIVSGQTEYNSRGLPEKKYLPFFSTTPLDQEDSIDPSRPHVKVGYDAMGRATQTTNPDGTYSTVIYDDWTTTSIDENGHKQTAYADAYGRLIKKEEYLGADGRSPFYPQNSYSLYSKTYYFYDSEGNLVQVEDSLGNITTIVYDVLGRKISMDDPDMGYWEYGYDKNGNLVWQKDAKDQELFFQYDNLNRLLSKTNEEMSSVNYYYDSEEGLDFGKGGFTKDGEDNFSIGRLRKAVYGIADKTSFVYDKVGREVFSDKKINNQAYEINRRYDALDRLTEITYPDKTGVIYTYNNAGQIDGIGLQSESSLEKGFSEDFKTIHGSASLPLGEEAQIPDSQNLLGNSNFSYAEFLKKEVTGDSKSDNLTASINPLQPLKKFRQLYNIDLSWNSSSEDTVIFVILIEKDTGVYYSGAWDWTDLENPETWHGDSVFASSGAGSTTIVKDLEIFDQLLGVDICNYWWIVEVRHIVPGQTYNQFDSGTYTTAFQILIDTTAAEPPEFNFSVSPQNPHPGVRAEYDFDISWNGLPVVPAEDYRLFYALKENISGYQNLAAADPESYGNWYGDVNMPSDQPNGDYIESKELIAYDEYNGDLITDYVWVAQLRRVHPGRSYNPFNSWSFFTPLSLEFPVEVGTGLHVEMTTNHYHPLVDREDSYEVSFSWTDPIPTFNNDDYDYKYYFSIVDEDSMELAALDDQGNWWEEEGFVTDGSPGTISINKNLTIINNESWQQNTNTFAWKGEIRRYPKNNTTDYITLVHCYDSVPGKDLGDEIFIRNVEYDAPGQITKIEYENGMMTTYTYEEDTLRLQKILTINPEGEAIQDLEYSYDSVGNIKMIVDSVNTDSQYFSYDALNRLIQAQGNYGIKTYQYDAIGNIIEKDGKAYAYGENGAGPHAVTSLSDGTVFSYDENGNMIEMIDDEGKFWQYNYDAENRLVEVKKNSALKAQYVYDGEGGRTQKIVYQGGAQCYDNNGKNKFFDLGKFAGDSHVNSSVSIAIGKKTTQYIGSLYEENSDGPLTYIYLGNRRIASVKNGEIMYYFNNHLGSINATTDAQGEVKELCEYLPFGLFSRHEMYGDSSQVSHFYFTGKKLDDETGLYYYGARYYNPLIGRFLTADPMMPNPTNSQSLNRYSYVYNSPLCYTDPSGNFPWLIIGAIIGAIAGAVSSYQQTGKVQWQSVLIGAVMGGMSGGTIGSTAQGMVLLKASAWMSLGSQVASATSRDPTISQGFTYAAMGLSAINFAWNVGKGIAAWISEEDKRMGFYRVFGGDSGLVYESIDPSEIPSGNTLYTNGVNTSLPDAAKDALQKHGASYLYYNPSAGSIADFTESIFQKIFRTSSLDRQFADGLAKIGGPINIIPHSQGTITTSNALMNLGLTGRQLAGGSTVTYMAAAISQPMAALSSWMGGANMTGCMNHIFDPINLVGPNLNPINIAGGAVGAGAMFGFSVHSNYGI